MSYFLIELALPLPLPAELIAIIPDQRARIDELLQEEKMLSYSLASDRSKVWAVVAAKDLFEAVSYLSDLPILRFAKPVVTELAFYNAPRFLFPALSLN